jgi:hypothetical protein
MGINPMKIIIRIRIRILFAVTLFQQEGTRAHLSLSPHNCIKTNGAQVWRGAAIAAAATSILVLAWTFS